MKTFSNKYIFIYISILVAVIASLLSLSAILLKPYQRANRENEKMQQILFAAGYGKVETESTKDLFASVCAPNNSFSEECYNVICKDNDSGLVVPVSGKGLWGPIWGYIVIANDKNTIKGAVFSHKSETPGLGAEISTDKFASSFIGKKIKDENGKYVSIKLVKGGAENAPNNGNNAVDAISGGTITSKGVEKMLYDCLKNYVK